jgi:flagellin-like hook-associated protein FlgL
MTSIITNTAAMAALATLRTIGQDMEETQSHVSSGLRVNRASDNAAYWSIATTMRSDNKALSTVQDALGLGAAKTDTAYTGLNSAIDVVSEIKAKLVAAREPGVDKAKIDSELTELKNQLVSISESASFSGENWLYNDDAVANTTVEMVGSFNRSSDNTVSVGILEFDTATSTLVDTVDAAKGLLTKDVAVTLGTGTNTTAAAYFLVNATSTTAATGVEIELSSATTSSDIDGMISAVETMLAEMTDSAATIGSTNMRIELKDNFFADMMDLIDKGIGRLVDADMNEESTKLKALQTQQQLGIQSLSIANSNSENVLSLFR